MAETSTPPAERDLRRGPSPRAVRAPSGRPLRRRQALPSGRAVIGGFLVALSALGIYGAWSAATAGPSERYLVARRDLPLGSQITPSDLALVTMDLPDSLVRNAAFTDPDELAGVTVVGAVRRGELVQAGDVLRRTGGPTDLEVSFSIEPSRALGGALVSGELVDVHATFGTGTDSYTAVVVAAARVLSTSSAGGPLADEAETITLAVKNRQEALALSHAVNAGEITLVRTGGNQPAGSNGDVYRAPASRTPAEDE